MVTPVGAFVLAPDDSSLQNYQQYRIVWYSPQYTVPWHTVQRETSARSPTARHHLCKTDNSIASCGTLRIIPYHVIPYSAVPCSICFLAAQHEQHETRGRSPTARHHLCKADNSIASRGTLCNIPYLLYSRSCGCSACSRWRQQPPLHVSTPYILTFCLQPPERARTRTRSCAPAPVHRRACLGGRERAHMQDYSCIRALMTSSVASFYTSPSCARPRRNF